MKEEWVYGVLIECNCAVKREQSFLQLALYQKL